MAATPVPVGTVTRAGLPRATPAACDNVNGNVIPNNGAITVRLQNTGGSSATVVFKLVNSPDGQAVTRTITLAAADDKDFGGFPTGLYGEELTFTASAATVKVAATQLSTS